MTLLPQTEDPRARLERRSFDSMGAPASEADELALVTQAWIEAQEYFGQEASYKLEYAACDLVYRSPRAYSFWEGSFVLEPNLRFFDVATQVNATIAQVMGALFAEDPPLVVMPGPNTSPESARAKGVLFGRLMKEAGPWSAANADRMPGLRHGFKEEFKRGVEAWALKGTFAARVYTTEEEQCVERREPSEIAIGHAGAPGAKQPTARKIGAPKITRTYKTVKRLKFEFIDLASEDCIVWNPDAKGGDIRLAKVVIQRRMVDFYDLQALALDPRYNIPGARLPEGYELDPNDDEQVARDEHDQEIIVGGSLIDLFFAPAETANQKATPQAAQMQQSLRGTIHQAKPESAVHVNPLRNRLEILEYLDQQTGHCITVLDQKVVIRSGDAGFFYLSANYWNLPNAMLGLGVGQIGANNQQLNQWIVNSALKVMAISLNAPHLAPDTIGQTPRVLRIGAGKVMTVTEQAFVAGGMKLLDTAKVDPSVWAVLQESTKRAESATGADSLLVQGSTQGPRAGMGRTAGGSNIMAGAAQTRLDGPMDNLIQQVFLPFIAAMDWFVFHFMDDAEIKQILGEELGKSFLEGDPDTGAKPFDWQDFRTGKFDYDVLLSAKLAALRVLAQQLVLIFEYGMNPEMQQFLADVHGTTIDLQTIYKLLLQVAHCSPGMANQIIRKLNPKEEARNEKRQQMQAQMGPGGKLAQIRAQGAVDSSLQEQKTFGNLAERALDKASLAQELSGAAEQ